jgi:predicted RNase H-like HicB family nuclease
MGSQITTVTVTLIDREDGGLRVRSVDLPGLILSGKDKAAVCASIAPAIEALLKHKGLNPRSIKPSKALDAVLGLPQPP